MTLQHWGQFIMLTANRVQPDLIRKGIEKHLKGKEGRLVVLIDQDNFETYPGTETIDVRKSLPSELASASMVLYAVDQDDFGAPFIHWLIEKKIKFYPVWSADPAQWVHKDAQARRAIDTEHDFQREAGFAKFDFGFGDQENICQALAMTRNVPGAFVEIGCFQGSSGCVALKYMESAGIFRPTFFLDVFDGFTYEAAKSSADAIWADTHQTEGQFIVGNRLKRFEKIPERPVSVIKSNIVTDDLPPGTDTIAVANLDVDQYEAVYAGLIKLAPRMAVRGILIVEDPGHTPLLIGAVAALERFMESDIAKNFVSIYMRSGQHFLVRVA